MATSFIPTSADHPHPSSWKDAALDSLLAIYSIKRNNPRPTIEEIRTEFDSFLQSLYVAPGGQVRAQAYWATIGATAAELADQMGIDLPIGLVHVTLCRKQRDYGPENIRRFGRQGIMVRCHDKIARIENLIESGAKPENEPLGDSLLDLIGYSAIGIMWERDHFLLPLVVDQ